MRFLHTADWHLGRVFHGVHLTEDQAHLLAQLVELARDARCDAVIVAGDVYDRAIPPAEAVDLLDATLCKLVLDLKVPTIVIAGNHDSSRRVGFAGRVLRHQGLHMAGEVAAHAQPIALQDDAGSIHVYPLPYAEPAVVRQHLGDAEIHTHQEALAAQLEDIRRRHPKGERSIVVAHCFVSGGRASESERPLSVGGAEAVEPACFDGFDYVALGHLHRPQASGERIHYSGSLMKYSFSEADHRKAVNIVEMDARGACSVERVRLAPARDVRCVSGLMREVLEAAADSPDADDYLMVTLLDSGPILDAMGRLREVYPNALHIERPALLARAEADAARPDQRKLSDAELFAAFFSQVTGEALTGPQADAYARVVDRMRRLQREGVS